MSTSLFFALIAFGLVVPTAAQDGSSLDVSYQTALIPTEYSLNVYAESGYYGASPIGYLQNGESVQLLGPVETPNGIPWVAITYGQGETGWIERHYVIGNVDRDVFCDDARVPELITALREAVRNRDSARLTEIVSPRGLYLAQHSDARVFLPPEVVANFFEDTTPRSWAHYDIGVDVYTAESLAVEVTDKLQRDLLPENITITCNINQDSLSDQAYLYAVRLPGYEVQNFYSTMRPGAPGFELDWGAWGIVIEYWDDEPVIMALGYYVWVP